MVKILVVDDHAIVRAGVGHFIAAASDMQIVAEASTVADAMRYVRTMTLDVVLLDISLPDQNGSEALSRIKREKPDLPVLILSMHPESRYAIQLLRSGASGYLQKEALATDLIEAIRIVSRGRKYISPAVAELLTAPPDESEKPLHSTLSKREFEIFNRLSQGIGVTKIAEDLCLSVKTVSTYRTRLLQKMNMTNNADLTYYAIKHELVV